MKYIEPGDMILAQDQYYSMDSYKTQLNNNVMVVGTSGSGKTRSIVSPNLLQATGSYIISDPKGTLYRKYADYLKKKGYKVRCLNFEHPELSSHYNLFHYIRTERDILRIAHSMVYAFDTPNNRMDPFWDQAAELLLTSLIGYLKYHRPEVDHNLQSVLKLVTACQVEEDCSSRETVLDKMMNEQEKRTPGCFACKQYKKFRIAAGKTLKSILITVNAKLGKYDFAELNQMMQKDDIEIERIGREKTALFVIVSDTDRSMDELANIFYNQAMDILCKSADNDYKDGRLPVPVRFIMDDFASSCKIDEFPRIIATIRSRNISAMLMLQAESQLSACYGPDGRTILGNCDTYIYLGGNDVDTARAVAERCDVPMTRILNMPVGTNWIFRRGQKPVNGRNFDLDSYKECLKLKNIRPKAIAPVEEKEKELEVAG